MHDSTTMNDDDDDDDNTLYVKGTSVTHPLLIHAPSNFFNSASSAFAGLVNTCLTSTVRYPRISGTGTGVPSVSVRKWGEKMCEKKKSVPFNAPTQITHHTNTKNKAAAPMAKRRIPFQLMVVVVVVCFGCSGSGGGEAHASMQLKLNCSNSIGQAVPPFAADTSTDLLRTLGTLLPQGAEHELHALHALTTQSTGASGGGGGAAASPSTGTCSNARGLPAAYGVAPSTCLFTAAESRASFTCAGVAPGLACSTSAAAPATCGVAIDVPDITANARL